MGGTRHPRRSARLAAVPHSDLVGEARWSETLRTQVRPYADHVLAEIERLRSKFTEDVSGLRAVAAGDRQGEHVLRGRQ
ncbi:hypothetical protein [Streptomyces durocortorensis]|uniref:Uncharacterized protein n=1 Tax=Streptomyces durocortorensis TaxID=2811104 RepID=A0ABS2I3G5_9ACTN|nr:hypothetical protein [Streptomyces durocortorensis]MBM7057754.1 hypothetical protein [Streptomyces durocortorensis]